MKTSNPSIPARLLGLAVAVSALVACNTAAPAASPQPGAQEMPETDAVCEAHCRHVYGCFGDRDEAEIASCTRDACESFEYAACEDEARAWFACIEHASCDAITAETDVCLAEESAWDACEADYGGSSSGSDWGSSSGGDWGSSSSGGGEAWACRYETRSRIACSGYSDVGDWTPGCQDVYASDEADAEAQCRDITDSSSSCDETGCCYERTYQAVEVVAGGC